MINFKNKKVLVTGASGGIGREIVKKFVSLEGSVLATGTNIEKLEILKKDFPNVNVIKFDINEHSNYFSMKGSRTFGILRSFILLWPIFLSNSSCHL